MQGTQLELLDELAAYPLGDAAHFVTGAADLSLGAIKAAMRYVLALSESSEDDTYRYVVRRENEIFLERFTGSYESILAKLSN